MAVMYLLPHCRKFKSQSQHSSLCTSTYRLLNTDMLEVP